MSKTFTPRWLMPKWSADSDAAVTRADFNAVSDQIELYGAQDVQVANFADLPAAGVRGRYGWVVNDEALYRDDGTQWRLASLVRMVSQGWHIASNFAAGLKDPVWIPAAACVLSSAWAVLAAGSGVKYRIYVNGASPTGMVDSGAVGTAASLFDFPDITLAAGDRVQVNVVNAGTAAAGLSVTVRGHWL